MRLLLDADVLLDCFVARDPYFAQWRRLRVMQYLGDAELWTSASSYATVFRVTRRACEAATIQDAFENSLSFLQVCSLDADDLKAVAAARWASFDDALVARAAAKVKASNILTHDPRRFAHASVPATTPDALLASMAEQGRTYEDVSW